MGQFSLKQIFSKVLRLSFSIAITYLSWDSLHQISISLMEGSAQGILEKSIAAPNPQSFISSGRALERPPAPTS